MTREQWRLARAVEALLATDDGLTDGDLATRLGAEPAALSQVLAVMYRQHRIVRCAQYVALPAPRPEPKPAA